MTGCTVKNYTHNHGCGGGRATIAQPSFFRLGATMRNQSATIEKSALKPRAIVRNHRPANSAQPPQPVSKDTGAWLRMVVSVSPGGFFFRTGRSALTKEVRHDEASRTWLRPNTQSAGASTG
jgi:hypothetical protein